MSPVPLRPEFILGLSRFAQLAAERPDAGAGALVIQGELGHSVIMDEASQQDLSLTRETWMTQ